jgi:hypothetical protein
MVLDQQVGQSVDGIVRDSTRFSPDSKRFVYEGKVLDHGIVICDGQPSIPYDGLGLAQFSADSQHVFYRARTNLKNFIVLDGDHMADYDAIADNGPKLLPDGSLVFIAQRGKNIVRVTAGLGG